MADGNSSIYGRVYLVTNKVNGKKYVGQTTQRISSRWSNHCNPKRISCKALGAAIALYGRNNFTLEVVALAMSKDELDLLEIKFITEHKSLTPYGYNIKTGGSKGKHPDSLKAQIRESMRKNFEDPEFLKKLSEGQLASWADPESRTRRMYGMKKAANTDHAKAIKSSAAKKLWQSEEFRVKVADSQAACKKPRSKEYRQKMSDKFKGRVFSEETKAKMVEAAKHRVWKPLSDEQKKKISNTRKGAIFSDEHKAKLSAARKAFVLRQKVNLINEF